MGSDFSFQIYQKSNFDKLVIFTILEPYEVPCKKSNFKQMTLLPKSNRNATEDINSERRDIKSNRPPSRLPKINSVTSFYSPFISLTPTDENETKKKQMCSSSPPYKPHPFFPFHDLVSDFVLDEVWILAEVFLWSYQIGFFTKKFHSLFYSALL